MSTLNIFKISENIAKTCLYDFVKIISAEFEINEEDIIKTINNYTKLSDGEKRCPFIATTGKNIGKPCGKKCKKDFCYNHQPDVIEKKKKEKIEQDENKVTIDGNDQEDIINNLFISWEKKDKTLEGKMSKNILHNLINKDIVVHEATDDENFEEEGYPVTICLAKTKLRVTYEDGEGLKKSLIPIKKSCLTQDQQQLLFDYINSDE